MVRAKEFQPSGRAVMSFFAAAGLVRREVQAVQAAAGHSACARPPEVFRVEADYLANYCRLYIHACSVIDHYHTN